MIRTTPFLFVGFLLATAGCASRGEPEVVAQDAAAQAATQNIEARLERLERNIAELQIELTRLAPVDNAAHVPAGPLADPGADSYSELGYKKLDVPPVRASRVGESDQIMPVSTSSPAEQFSVHLASYRDPGLSRSGWQSLRRQYGSLLGALVPVQSKVELEGRGTFYRLKAGPFDSWNAAESACGVLRQSGQSCAVMDYSGEPLTMVSAAKSRAGY